MIQPKYYFYPNPHDEYAWTKCPKCDAKTKLRKFCLMIHYEDKPLRFHRMLSLRMDCKLCTECELIIKKKTEIESYLKMAVESWGMKFNPKNYLVFGTMEMQDWKQNQLTPIDPSKALEKIAPFKDVLDFKIQPAGWYFTGDKG